MSGADRINRLAPEMIADRAFTVIEDGMFRLPERRAVSNKGDYPHVLIIGGSDVMCGAPMMALHSANAAFRGGAGLVTLAVPSCLKIPFMARTLQNTLAYLPDDGERFRFDGAGIDALVSNKDAIALGMGMGKCYGEIEKLIESLCGFSGSLIIDADGLNALQGRTEPFSRLGATVLTPHLREFMRLTGIDDIAYLRKFRLSLAADFAKKYGVVLVLKDALTVVTDGEKIFVNTAGTPAMAKGGTGDMLSGLAAALAAVLPPLDAAAYAAFVLGKAGENAEKLCGAHSVVAEDIVANIRVW